MSPDVTKINRVAARKSTPTDKHLSNVVTRANGACPGFGVLRSGQTAAMYAQRGVAWKP